MNAIDELADSFSRLPGIGKKSATRIAYHLLKGDPAFCHQFARELTTLHERIKQCSVCGVFTETDPCVICSDPLRDHSLICVVEQPQDAAIIDASHEFPGLFHVLGGVIAPLEGVGPDQLNISSLVERIRRDNVKEVIIATNPTVEGDTTALYLQRILSPLGITVSRLASGLPVGGDIEYADKLTLARSFRGRTTL
ncbi:MAG: recombination mediator RecR [Treponemataceae bacterium]|nr:recombination mediator RecR [Treponemataceae bacterium]